MPRFTFEIDISSFQGGDAEAKKWMQNMMNAHTRFPVIVLSAKSIDAPKPAPPWSPPPSADDGVGE
jgi:hypothetical protein